MGRESGREEFGDDIVCSGMYKLCVWRLELLLWRWCLRLSSSCPQCAACIHTLYILVFLRPSIHYKDSCDIVLPRSNSITSDGTMAVFEASSEECFDTYPDIMELISSMENGLDLKEEPTFDQALQARIDKVILSSSDACLDFKEVAAAAKETSGVSNTPQPYRSIRTEIQRKQDIRSRNRKPPAAYESADDLDLTARLSESLQMRRPDPKDVVHPTWDEAIEAEIAKVDLNKPGSYIDAEDLLAAAAKAVEEGEARAEAEREAKSRKRKHETQCRHCLGLMRCVQQRRG